MISIDGLASYVSGTSGVSNATVPAYVPSYNNRVLLCFIGHKASAAGTVNSVTFTDSGSSAHAMTRLCYAGSGADEPSMDVYYYLAPVAGTGSIYVVFSAARNTAIVSLTASYVSQIAPFYYGLNSIVQTGVAASFEPSSDYTGMVVLDGLCRYHSTGPITADTGQTEDANIVTGRVDNLAYNIRVGVSHKDGVVSANHVGWTWSTSRTFVYLPVVLYPQIDPFQTVIF